MELRAVFLPALAHLPEPALTAMLAGEPEGAAYQAALAMMQPGGMTTRAVAVQDKRGETLLAAPLFELGYRLDTPLQGAARRMADKIHALAPRLLTLSLLGLGSPYTDAAPLLEMPGITPPERLDAFSCLLAALEAEATRTGASLIGFKDLAPRELAFYDKALRAAGYVCITSLPVAEMAVCAPEEWLATLSRATRRDIRRKLARAEARRAAGTITIEHRADLGPHAQAVAALYEETRSTSEVGYGDFERLPEDYFTRIAESTPARFSFYSAGGSLIGFNLLLLGAERAIDKFIGLKQPQARDNDLYALSFVENLRFCHESGLKMLQTGQTAYADKLRFGARLEPRALFARHRSRWLNALLRRAAPRLDFTRHDPVLGTTAMQELAA